MTRAIDHWRKVAVVSVGGLTEVGFSSDEKYVLVLSGSGRAVVSTSDGSRVARDREGPRLESPWLRESALEAEGIGPIAGVWLQVVGLWGGTLPKTSPDGWRLEQREVGEGVTVTLECGDAEPLFVDAPITEVRAAGFSMQGGHVLVATSSDLTLISRVGWPTTRCS